MAEVVTGVGLGAGAFAFSRRFGGSAALETLERANRVLERRVDELTVENARLRADVATLTARTDVATALAPVLAALTSHEEHAARRSEATLHVLGMIAGKLGGEEAA